MALSKAMQEMLDTIKDETARKAFQAQLEDNLAVREHFEGNLRQSDYDRQMNANKSEVERLKGLEEKALQWKKWAEENMPRHEAVLKTLAEKDAELADLKAKAAAG